MKCSWARAMAFALFLSLTTGGMVAAQSSAPSEASGPGEPAENLITMNFQDVDLAVLAKFISEITGKNFVLDESVRGKVTIIKPGKVTPEQAYSIFMSALQLEGFTTVDAEPVIKIIPSRDLRRAAGQTGQNLAQVRDLQNQIDTLRTSSTNQVHDLQSQINALRAHNPDWGRYLSDYSSMAHFFEARNKELTGINGVLEHEVATLQWWRRAAIVAITLAVLMFAITLAVLVVRVPKARNP